MWKSRLSVSAVALVGAHHAHLSTLVGGFYASWTYNYGRAVSERDHKNVSVSKPLRSKAVLLSSNQGRPRKIFVQRDILQERWKKWNPFDCRCRLHGFTPLSLPICQCHLQHFYQTYFWLEVALWARVLWLKRFFIIARVWMCTNARIKTEKQKTGGSTISRLTVLINVACNWTTNTRAHICAHTSQQGSSA